MRIYGLSDPHLSISIPDKTMEVFGEKWKNYIDRLKVNWNNIVNKEDMVIMPGDISWCTRLNETYDDFKFLDELNGYKFMSKGNHDYWFSTKRKVNNYIRENFSTLILVERDFYNYQDKFIIAGYKGFNPQVDKLVFEKQLLKKYNSLRLMLKDIYKQHGDLPIMLSYHFPPIFDGEMRFHKLFKKHNVKHCLYGHIHEEYGSIEMPMGDIDGVQYHFVAADCLEFKPKLIYEL